MRCVYGRNFERRYTDLLPHVPEGVSVVDLCAGAAYLYRRYLSTMGVSYHGLDYSRHFVERGRARGVRMDEFDVHRDPIPEADVVMMQASLYQFMDHAPALIRRMLAAARRKVIITEAIVSLSDSRNPLLASFARRVTTPAGAPQGYTGSRFTRESLDALFRAFPSFVESFAIAGGRELAGVFRGSQGEQAPRGSSGQAVESLDLGHDPNDVGVAKLLVNGQV